ncbi:MAG: diacylglycerol/lipid kinase family protein [Nocardioides sp.]
MTPGAGVWGRLPRRWLARLTFVLVLAAGVVLVVGSAEHGAPLLLTVLAGIVVVLASTYWFLANRGWLRTLALVLLVAAPVAVAWTVVAAGLVLELLVVAALLLVALTTGRAALAPPGGRARMPEHSAPPPRRPFIVMNPRSGGGKVGRFGLREKAERLGAEVVLLEGPDQVDVALLARHAVAEGADLLGVAGGDGTQALVAGVAADAGVPFMVISAGTRNHFALDLGLDREDPSTCLAALTADAVELHVDLGVVAGRTFVNNASFGAYAAVVQSPEYRDGKTRTTLGLLPDLLSGQAGSRLQVRVDGLTVENPQAVLVSVNPYGMGDVAGLGRRARLDTGELGVVAVTVDSARQAVRLLRHTKDHGLTHAGGPEVVITADTPQIPVGIDGEAVVVDSPVTCTVHPRALRVRVPRHRPGVPPAQPPWNWIALWRLAWPSRSRRGRLR